MYAKSLVKLREIEEELVRDQMDELDSYVAGSADVNYLFDRYISTKTELRSTTKTNYLYTWNHFIRDTFGKKKIKDVVDKGVNEAEYIGDRVEHITDKVKKGATN